VQEAANTLQRVPYRFTGKELDEETGLYYFGARYYDPRTSVWQSADPILEKYLPSGDKEKDARMPGIGGVFNSRNIAMYTYTHQNPVKLVDPDGKKTTVITILDPDGWDHSALHIDNPKGKQTLYDPAGRGYNPRNEAGPQRGSSQNLFNGDVADLDSYIKANQEAYPNAEIILQEFDTTPDQESAIYKRMSTLENEDPMVGKCTSFCISAIEGVGPFKDGGLLEPGIKPWTMQPEGLMDDLTGLNPSNTIKLPPPPKESE
jgi:RHS repeat-associated protein